VAALLEIAGKFAAEKPERSALFIAVTLEESGLLGSAWYVAHPAFPLRQTVADINMDALPVIGPAHDMVVTGAGYSELDEYLAAALAAQGRHLTPSQHPEGGYYFRSDHFPFAKAGVPALYAQGGSDLIEGGTKAGEAVLADYVEHHYHQVSDNYNPDWDFRGVIQDVEALYQVGATLANETKFPAWAKDSPFRAKRQAMMDAKR
jgi:Zn-dependent M28 family amino/carboxypeptidase